MRWDNNVKLMHESTGNMKVLLTGTHFTPAIAVMEKLKKYQGIKIVYVGRTTTMEGDATPSLESQILPKMGIKFIPLIAGRWQRFISPFIVISLLKIPFGFVQALLLVFLEKPDVILSFGGYVALPVVIAGWLFSIPIIIHEQTLLAGLSNRISAIFADKIAISFKESKKFFNREKTILTGNPIRKDLLDIAVGNVSTRRPNKDVMVLIMGGSQGSHAINLAVWECLDKLIKFASIIHVTGDNKFGDFEKSKRLGELMKLGKRYQVFKWIGEDYGIYLKKADLVVCRAGINTLSELAYVGKPALVIPIPYIYLDEQNQNARYFEGLGLVKILPQSKLSGVK